MQKNKTHIIIYVLLICFFGCTENPDFFCVKELSESIKKNVKEVEYSNDIIVKLKYLPVEYMILKENGVDTMSFSQMDKAKKAYSHYMYFGFTIISNGHDYYANPNVMSNPALSDLGSHFKLIYVDEDNNIEVQTPIFCQINKTFDISRQTTGIIAFPYTQNTKTSEIQLKVFNLDLNNKESHVSFSKNEINVL